MTTATTTASDSAGFEPDEDGDYLQRPSPKRLRYDAESATGNGHDAHTLVEVPELVEAVQVEDAGEAETVTITVPSSQFEIEISQAEEEDGEEIPQIQRSDLTGPNFNIVQDSQELTTLDSSSHLDEGGTLNAIGRALLQIQQSGAQKQPLPISSTISPAPGNQQIYLSRSTSVPESGTPGSGGGGPLYVMIPPASSAEILQAMGQSRPIAPKAASPTLELTQQESGDPKSREAQRKATHNEVERRRRDRINDLIKTLAMIVPGCQKKDATTGSIVGYVYSKGTVLDKTVEYLKELMDKNEKLANTAKLAEKSASALALVQNQIAVLEKENAFLRAQIIQFGIDAAASSSGSTSHHQQQQQQQQQHQQQQQQHSSAMLNRPFLSSPLAQSLLNTVAQSTQPSTSVAALPPVTPPLPPPSAALDPSTPAAAQQLLISLAQTLTNSPLLTSLSQNSALPPPPPQATTPSAAAAAAASSLINASNSSLLATTAPAASSSSAAAPSAVSSSLLTPVVSSQSLPQVSLTPVTPQPMPTPSVVPPPTTALQASPSQVTPLITSLVQTLSSIANTNMISSPAPALPKASPTNQAIAPQPSMPLGGVGGSGGLSAAAAASLLNTLIVAQNVLTGNSGIGPTAGGIALSDLSSVLTGNVNVERVDQ